jgi:hypothetical protein
LDPPDISAIPDWRRKEVFRILVVAQDLEMGVSESRQLIRDRFGLSDAAIRHIEREGIAGRWPLLGQA